MSNLAYTLWDRQHSDIYHRGDTDPPDIPPRNLTNNSAHNLDPCWSPVSDEIAFTSNRDTGAWALYTVEAGPSLGQATRLTSGKQNDFQPTWSPDGSRIAFVRNSVEDLWLARRTGGSLMIKPRGGGASITLVEGMRCLHPTWSPDGRRIAFKCQRSIWVISVQAGMSEIPRQVTDGQQFDDDDPAWSTRGIVFTRWEGNWNSEIWTMYHDFEGLQAVAAPDPKERGRIFYGEPSWDPVGRITFTRWEITEPFSEIWMVDARHVGSTPPERFLAEDRVYQPNWQPRRRRSPEESMDRISPAEAWATVPRASRS